MPVEFNPCLAHEPPLPHVCPQTQTTASYCCPVKPTASSSASSFQPQGECLSLITADPIIDRFVITGNDRLSRFLWCVLRRLVSSYKGKFGYVRYYTRAVLDRVSQHALKCEKEFEVEEPLDINRPELLVRKHDSKTNGLTVSPNWRKSQFSWFKLLLHDQTNRFNHHQLLVFLPLSSSLVSLHLSENMRLETCCSDDISTEFVPGNSRVKWKAL